MANFTTLRLSPNTGTNGSPTWTDYLGGANTEIRWSDTGTGLLSTASASWPAMLRPGSTGGVNYTYAYTADATGKGFIDAGSSNPTSFDDANYLFARWDWDALGTFASAPITTAYPSSSHESITRGDGSLLGGHATDTGGTARSYLKCNAYGQDVGTGAPGASPSNDPTVTDGTTGSVSPTAGGNWLTNYQGLMGDTDYITAPFTPTATSADQWNIIFRLFTGPNMTPGTYTCVLTLKYTYT